MHLQLSFATARVAPEKRFHRPPAAGSFNDVMEMNMELQNEPRTTVYVNPNSQIVVNQPDEACLNCGGTETSYVYFSPDRARKVAREMLRLADELEAGGQ